MGRLSGKKALITGGAQGIGARIGEMMATEGADVALSDINADGASQTAEKIAAATGCNTVGIAHDVTNADAWETVVGEAEAALGGLNVLVNNAGVCIPGSVESISLEDWHRTMDIDLNAVFLGCRAALPVIAKHAPGSIINISSIAGLIASNNFVAYNTAKAGVWMLTKSVALQATRQGLPQRTVGLACPFRPIWPPDPPPAAPAPHKMRAPSVPETAAQIHLR